MMLSFEIHKTTWKESFAFYPLFFSPIGKIIRSGGLQIYLSPSSSSHWMEFKMPLLQNRSKNTTQRRTYVNVSVTTQGILRYSVDVASTFPWVIIVSFKNHKEIYIYCQSCFGRKPLTVTLPSTQIICSVM